MSAIVHEGLIDAQTIDNWNKHMEKIPCEESKAWDGDDFANNPSIRQCDIRWVAFNKHPRLYKSVANEILPVLDAESSALNVNIFRSLEIQHTTYNVGGHYDRHRDTDIYNSEKHTIQRKVSIVVMLSDPQEYQGGDLYVSGIAVPKTKGTVALFHSWRLHKVDPVTQGIRRSLVVWANGPPWR